MDLGEVATKMFMDKIGANLDSGAVGSALSHKLGSFASQLGLSQGDAAKSLADMLPNLIDQSSKGGSLLDALGGLGGLASKLLK